MNLNYFRIEHEHIFLKLLQKYEEVFDETLGKCTDSDYTIQLT